MADTSGESSGNDDEEIVAPAAGPSADDIFTAVWT